MHIYTDAVIKMCSKMVTLLVRNDAGQSLQKKQHLWYVSCVLEREWYVSA